MCIDDGQPSKRMAPPAPSSPVPGPCATAAAACSSKAGLQQGECPRRGDGVSDPEHGASVGNERLLQGYSLPAVSWDHQDGGGELVLCRAVHENASVDLWIANVALSAVGACMRQYGEFRCGYGKDKEDTRMVSYGIRYLVENYVSRQWTMQDIDQAERFYR